MSRRFVGRVCAVTGGAQGIGRGIAERLLREGATVYLLDLNAALLEQSRAELLEAGLTGVRTCPADVADEASVAAAFDAIAAAESGRLDVVVNSAGIVGPNGVQTHEVALSDFDRVCSINLRGSFIVVKHAVRHMLPRSYGRILLIASIAGKDGNAGMCPYSVSKAGVIGLVKASGKEYAETGITVNGLAPAVVRTAMVEAMKPEQVKYMTDKIPMKRCCTIDEIAATAAFIVSDETSFNTGFTFDLSGGRAVY